MPCDGLPSLCAGWKEAVDERGKPYYYNKQLQLTQYEHPHQPVDSPPLPPPRMVDFRADKRSPLHSSPRYRDTYRKHSTYHVIQLQREHARLRAKLAYVSGTEKAEVSGDLAVVESELYALM